jgi:hypothetical protein
MRLITGGSPFLDRGIAEGVDAAGEPLGVADGDDEEDEEAGGDCGADAGGPGVWLGSAPPGPREATGAAARAWGVPL